MARGRQHHITCRRVVAKRAARRIVFLSPRRPRTSTSSVVDSFASVGGGFVSSLLPRVVDDVTGACFPHQV